MTIETFVKGLTLLGFAGMITWGAANNLEKSLPDKISRGEITAEAGQIQKQTAKDLQLYGSLAGYIGLGFAGVTVLAARRPKIGGGTYYHGRRI
jgi:hypothetical protein